MRHCNARAWPQDEDSFVRKATQIRDTYNHLNGDDSYVDSTHPEYHHTTTASTAIKLARDDSAFLVGFAQGATAKTSAFTQANAATASFSNDVASRSGPFNLNAIGNLDSAASAFNGFGHGGGNGGYSFPSGTYAYSLSNVLFRTRSH